MSRRVFLLLLICGAPGVFPVADDLVVFRPYVSDLRAEVSGARVCLKWLDSPDAAGKVFIYRSREPFKDNEDHSRKLAGEAAYGVMAYTDNAPGGGKWYYLVAASEGEKSFNMAVPLNNMVEVMIDGSNSVAVASAYGLPDTSLDEFNSRRKREAVLLAGTERSAEGGLVPPSYGAASPAQAAAPCGQTALPQGAGNYAAGFRGAVSTPSPTLALTGLTAVQSGDGIYVSFLSGNPSKKAVLYRSIQPVRSLRDLLSAEIILLPGAVSPHIDSGNPGTPYYYAVVYEEDIRDGSAYISPGYNATIYPVVLPAAQLKGRQGAPADCGDTGGAWGPQSDRQGRLSPEAAAALESSSFASPVPYQPGVSPKIKITEPEIFREERTNQTPGTDEFRLGGIIRGVFAGKNWRAAVTALQNFITAGSNPVVKARARFYLGEAYYFTGDSGRALTEFLSVQSRFPEESSVWIQAALNKLSQ